MKQIDQFWQQNRNRRGRDSGLELGIIDLTANHRKKPIHDTQAALQQMQAGVEALSEGFALFDADEALLYCNAAFRNRYPDLAGFLEPGLSWRVFLHEAQRRHSATELGQLDAHLDSGIELPLTLDASRRGSRWFRMSVHPVSDGGFVLTEADMTDQQQASEIIEHADDLLRNILDACASRIALVRASDGRLQYRTPAWDHTFGIHEHLQTSFRDRVSYSGFLADLLPTGSLDDHETPMARADAQHFPARLSARVIDYQGEAAMVVSVEDLTLLHAQRDELRRRRESAFQNEKLSALGQLLAGVAHELNNPLSVVVGHAMMLREEVTDAETLDSVDRISRSAQRCAKIVKTFLAMARQQPAELEQVSLNDIVSSALEIASYSMSGKGISIEQELAQGLPMLELDETQVTQVFINLFVNAEHALSESSASPCLRVSTAFEANSECVVARVSDNGPGIPAMIKHRIFEPFYTTKAVDEGTGVGLALSHRIVSTHGGRLDLGDSELGGATFEIALPAARESTALPESTLPSLQMPTLKALLVEDEPDVADMFKRVLAGRGMLVRVAHSAREGLEYLTEDNAVDLIFCDLRMPGMGGREMLQTVRQRWPVLADRFVFVTGDAIGEDAAAIRQQATHPLLEKPVSPAELDAIIQFQLRTRPSDF